MKWYDKNKMKKPTVSVEETKARISVNTVVVVLIIVIGLMIGGVVLLTSGKSKLATKQNKQKPDVKAETEQLIKKVGILYDLPTGEAPTIATVSDKTKLEKQSFFAKAENGDKVLIYTNAKKAILYRPSINKIMEVAPLALSQDTEPPRASKPEVSPTQEAIAPVEVSIYNGTKTAGVASSTEKKVTAAYSFADVVEKADAEKNYSKTIIVDVSKKNSLAAQKLAELLSGSVESLPSGENAPQGDILIIVGE